jgi:small-conductance mechanosensitive channel
MNWIRFIWDRWSSFFDKENVSHVLESIIILILGFIAVKILNKVLQKSLRQRMERGQFLLIQKIITYTIFIYILSLILNQLGISFSVLLGTAGILTVALGFASQTSVSNVISGLFLIGEKPFDVGNVIEVDGTMGEVLSIDLMSVKLRTFDNLYVRIPNESMIKTKIINCTRFPTRRLDAKVRVAYKEDLKKVSEILLQVAEKSSLVLKTPPPKIFFTGFGESSMDLQFSIWFARNDFINSSHIIYREIKEAFEQAGIEIPFPHRTIIHD